VDVCAGVRAREHLVLGAGLESVAGVALSKREKKYLVRNHTQEKEHTKRAIKGVLEGLEEDEVKQKMGSVEKEVEELKKLLAADNVEVPTFEQVQGNMSKMLKELELSEDGFKTDTHKRFRLKTLEYHMLTLHKTIAKLKKDNSNPTIKLGLSPRSLFSAEEMEKSNGARPSPSEQTTKKVLLEQKAWVNNITELDWREYGAVSPVMDQGQCGGCYSFSAAGAMEGMYAVLTGNLYQLSPFQLVSCDNSMFSGNQGCQGGMYTNFWVNGGYTVKTPVEVEATSNFPPGAVSSNNAQSMLATPSQCTTFAQSGVVSTLAGAVELNQDQNYAQNYNQILRDALVLYGPVSISLAASCPHFNYYQSGLVSSCGGAPGAYTIDHAVLVVGYNTTANPPYWIVKNSWGTSWGLEGFVYIEMKDNYVLELPPNSGWGTAYGVVGMNVKPAVPAGTTQPANCGTNGTVCAGKYALSTNNTPPEGPNRGPNSAPKIFIKSALLASCMIFLQGV